MKAQTGQPTPRVDGRLKVTGQAKYAADFRPHGLVHAVLVGSTIARGSLRSIDGRRAEQAAGVLGVLTYRNAPRLSPGRPYNPVDFKNSGASTQSPLPLQDEHIVAAGEPVALVVAETVEQARYAASLVSVDYVSEAPVATFESAIASAYPAKLFGVLPPGLGRGDVRAGLAAGAVRVEATYRTPTEHHVPIELHGCVAHWTAGSLTLYSPTQWVGGVQLEVAANFGLRPDQVHVINPFLGGGFGSKAAWHYNTLAAMAAKVVGRPVKLVLTRAQTFTSNGYRPPTVHEVRLAATREGRLTAIEHRQTCQTSFSADLTPEAGIFTTLMLYACPNVSVSFRLAKVNAGNPWFMRAPGEASGMWALESAMDELAQALGMDPIDLRLRNHAEADPSEGKPKAFSSKSLRACYELGAREFGWSDRRAPGAHVDRDWLVGVGMATATYPVLRLASSARARLGRDGVLEISTASHELGTGTYTALALIAGEAMGLPLQRVRVLLGDTDLPSAPISAGAMTIASVGSAVLAACDALKARLVALAVATDGSPMRGMPLAGLRADGDAAYDPASTTSRITVSQLMTTASIPHVEADATSEPSADAARFSMQSFGAHFARVRVHRVTRVVHVDHLLGAYAAGKIVNPLAARSQMVGGMTFGLGMSLMEETVTDPRTGRYINANLGGYLVPVSLDVPTVSVFFVEEHDSAVNPIGAKGIGELPNVGVAAAIGNAVFNATGKRVRDLPMLPEKLREEASGMRE